MLENMAVKTKILLLSVLMIAIICIVAAVGIFFNAKAQDALDNMYNSNLMATQYLNDANGHLRVIDVNVPYILLTGSNSLDPKLLQEDILSRLDSISGDIDKVKEISHSEKSLEIIARLEQHINEVRAKVKESEGLGNTPADRQKLFENLSSVRSVANDLAALTPDNVAAGKFLFEESKIQYERSLKIFAVIVIIGLVFGVTSAIIIAGNIAAPLSTAIESLNAVADGDLTKTMPEELMGRRDEVGNVVGALNKMQTSLSGIIASVGDEAQKSADMAANVQELLRSLNADTQDMSAVTEEMAAGMEQTAASTVNMQTLSDKLQAEIKMSAEKSGESESYTEEINQRAADLKASTQISVRKSEEIYSKTKESLEKAIESA